MRAFVLAALLVISATVSASAGLVAKIDISAQTMTVSRDGDVLYSWAVSTARKGYRTPRGSFRPTRLHKMWYSRKYDNAPMPNSIFFYWRLCDPRDAPYQEPRAPCLPRLRPPASGKREDPL